jgi:MFS family permease
VRAAPRPGVILALVCAAAFMGVLDIAIVNVALPSIQRDLGLPQSSSASVRASTAWPGREVRCVNGSHGAGSVRVRCHGQRSLPRSSRVLHR